VSDVGYLALSDAEIAAETDKLPCTVAATLTFPSFDGGKEQF